MINHLLKICRTWIYIVSPNFLWGQVRTWTGPGPTPRSGSAEGQGQGQTHCGPDLEGQGQVQQNWSRTWPGPDRGQSTSNTYNYTLRHLIHLYHPYLYCGRVRAVRCVCTN